MALENTKVGFLYGTTIPTVTSVGKFYIVATNDYPELYLATTTVGSEAQHIGSLHTVASPAGLPTSGDAHALFFSESNSGLYHWSGTAFVRINEGQIYNADDVTIALSAGNAFSVKDGGIGTTQLAANAVTNAKLAAQAAYTIKANNTNQSSTPLDVQLINLILNGYAKTVDTGSIAATDSLVVAFSKIENNLTNIIKSANTLTAGYLVQGSGSRNIEVTSVLTSNVVTQATASSTDGVVMVSSGSKGILPSSYAFSNTVTDSATSVPTGAAVIDYAQPISDQLTKIAAVPNTAGLLRQSLSDSTWVWGIDTNAYIAETQKGVANGVAPLGEDNKVSSQYLPSYVDDVIDEICFCNAYSTAPTEVDGSFYFNTTAPATLYKGVSGAWSAYTPTTITQFGNLTDNLIYNYSASAWGNTATPVKGVLYVDDSNEMVYRWTGTAFALISTGQTYWGTIGGTLTDQTDLANALAQLVTGPSSSVNGNVAAYNSTTGKLIKDSGVAAANLVTATSNFAAKQIVIGGNTTGKTAQTLAAGTEGQVLKVVSGVPAWGTEYSYTLTVASASALGGVMIGYTASGATIPVELSSNRAYVALTSTAIDSAKPNLVTSSSVITAGKLIMASSTARGIEDSGLVAANVVSTTSTMTADTFVLGNGGKTIKNSSYTFSTSISGAGSATQIASTAAIVTYVDSQALVWGTF